MVIVNFGHPISPEQQRQVEALTGEPVDRIINVPVQFDDGQPFGPQVTRMVEATMLAPADWQSLPLVINPPSFGPIVAVLVAYVHGLSGHFPTLLRMRPIPGNPVPRFELGELLDLQQVRNGARQRR